MSDDLLRVLFEAIQTPLREQPAIAAHVAGRIYNDYAQADAALPYLVLSLNALTHPNADALDEAVALVNVQAVCDADTQGSGKAAEIIDAVRGVLHNRTLDLAPGWTCRRCEAQSAYRMTELVDRRRYSVAGVLVRIEADRE